MGLFAQGIGFDAGFGLIHGISEATWASSSAQSWFQASLLRFSGSCSSSYRSLAPKGVKFSNDRYGLGSPPKSMTRRQSKACSWERGYSCSSAAIQALKSRWAMRRIRAASRCRSEGTKFPAVSIGLSHHMLAGQAALLNLPMGIKEQINRDPVMGQLVSQRPCFLKTRMTG